MKADADSNVATDFGSDIFMTQLMSENIAS